MILQRGEAGLFVDFDDDRVLRLREKIEDELFELDRVRHVGLHLGAEEGLARFAPRLTVDDNVGNLLLGDVIREGPGVIGFRFEEIDVHQTDGDTPRPDGARTVRLAPFGRRVGDVAVFDHVERAVDHHHISDPVFRRRLAHDLARILGARHQMVADELGAADVDDRVVDLKVEELFDAAPPEFGQCPRPPNLFEGGVGLRTVDRGEESAVPVGTSGDLPFFGQKHLAVVVADRGDGSLAEDQDVFVGEAEIFILFKERDRLFVGGGTGLNAEGDSRTILPRRRPDPLDVDLKEGDPRNGSDRIDPFGVGEIEAGSLPPRDDRRRQFAGAERLFPTSDRFVRIERASRIGGAISPLAQIAQAERGRFLGPVGQRRGLGGFPPAGVEFFDPGQIERADLIGEDAPVFRRKFVPEGQKMLLTVGGEKGGEFVFD